VNTPTVAVPILSHLQTTPLLKARQQGAKSVAISPDLGLTTVEVVLTASGVCFPEDAVLSWAGVEQIDADRNGCYRVVGTQPVPIRGYSEVLGRSHSLYPTQSAPAMIIAGFPMHRIKGTDPLRACLLMVRAIAPVRGHVLDTATGLGYTAIEAAKTADHVTTIELDPGALDMARANPWSRGLFGNPKITQIMGDSAEVIAGFAPETFSRIMHDPPTLSLAGDLYSGAFYRHTWRVLRSDGRMFHYIGDPESRSASSTTRGVIRRLHEAGFAKVMLDREAHGVVAVK
jgi:predicted methyltransferase